MFIKLLPYLIGLALIASGLAYLHHKIYSEGHAAGYAEGKAEVQGQFDTFKQEQHALVIKKQQEDAEKDAASVIANAKALASFQRQLNNSHAYSDYLVSRLRPYLDSPSPGSGGMSKNPDQPGTAHPGQAPSATGIGERIGDAIAECRSNDAQLDALRDELIPQL